MAELPDGLVDRDLALDTNVGIPEGRNLGAAATSAPLLLFLDDDARLLGEASLAAVVHEFDDDPQLGVLGMRLVDEQGETSRRHVPRVGRGGAHRAGEVTSFPGGACCIRAAALAAVGGFRGDYFYAMEETDLAWRLIDGGWTIRYAAEHVVFHPRTEPSRHPEAAWRTARNRTWLAYRLLPLPLAPVYLLDWLLITHGAALGSVGRVRAWGPRRVAHTRGPAATAAVADGLEAHPPRSPSDRLSGSIRESAGSSTGRRGVPGHSTPPTPYRSAASACAPAGPHSRLRASLIAVRPAKRAV